jgi:hypothetical protein
MNNLKAILTVILNISSLWFYGQEVDSIFKVERMPFKQFDNSMLKQQLYEDCFYEDSTFKAYSGCMGEFGGKIKFVHKGKGKDRVIKATCPVSINKIGSDYYITSSLAHLSGSTSIEKISNLNSNQTILKVSSILYTSNILALGSFTFNQQLYHLITNRDKTFIASVKNGKIETVVNLLDQDLFSRETSLIVTKDGATVLIIKKRHRFFKRTIGYIAIKDGLITVALK